MDKMRNMIRIKDVPSNTIEEAIIILKENKKAKKYESSSKFKNMDSIDGDNNKHVIKEAELIISEYLEKNEDSNKNANKNKIKKLRVANIVLLLSLIMSIIL